MARQVPLMRQASLCRLKQFQIGYRVPIISHFLIFFYRTLLLTNTRAYLCEKGSDENKEHIVNKQEAEQCNADLKGNENVVYAVLGFICFSGSNPTDIHLNPVRGTECSTNISIINLRKRFRRNSNQSYQTVLFTLSMPRSRY